MLRARAAILGLCVTGVAASGMTQACIGDDPSVGAADTSDATIEGLEDSGALEGGDSAALDAHVPRYCELSDARSCTDFEDVPVGSSTDWNRVLAARETVGTGKTPRVATSPVASERGRYYVSELSGIGGGETYESSRRSLQVNNPGWTTGVPQRLIRFKLFVSRYAVGAASRVIVLTWDGGVDGAPGAALWLQCDGDGGQPSCKLVAVRTDGERDTVSIRPTTWTEVLVTIPTAPYLDGGEGVSSKALTVAVTPLGGSPQDRTVLFGSDTKAPHAQRIDVGLSLPYAKQVDWEVFYDDFSAEY